MLWSSDEVNRYDIYLPHAPQGITCGFLVQAVRRLSIVCLLLLDTPLQFYIISDLLCPLPLVSNHTPPCRFSCTVDRTTSNRVPVPSTPQSVQDTSREPKVCLVGISYLEKANTFQESETKIPHGLSFDDVLQNRALPVSVDDKGVLPLLTQSSHAP